jgi:hypothetical protein
MTVTATIDGNAKVNKTLKRTAHHGVGGRRTSIDLELEDVYLTRKSGKGIETSAENH